ncbi:MAG: CoA transferase, partial [Pseudomonadota bacterium]
EFAGTEDLAAWTRSQQGHALADRLQQAGIAAGVVQDIEDLLERDPMLEIRGALPRIDHAALGPFGHVRTPLTFSGEVTAPFRSPKIGEHGRDIARELAGLSNRRIDELEAAGVFK